MVEPPNLNFRVFTVKLVGGRKRNFTVVLIAEHAYLYDLVRNLRNQIFNVSVWQYNIYESLNFILN